MLVTTNETPRFGTFTHFEPAHAGSCGNRYSHAPTHEQVQRRAYEIYVSHGRSEGHSDEDWWQAERQLAVYEGDTAETGKYISAALR